MIACLAFAAQSPPPVIVGALDRPGCGLGAGRGVRPLFARTQSDWAILDSAAAQAWTAGQRFWTVAFDGRNLGTVTTVSTGPSNSGWSFTRDHRLQLLDSSRVPAVRNPQGAFEGWCEAPAERPLVVVSEANYRDPEGWRPFTPAASLRRVLFPRFRSLVDSVIICPGNGEREVLWPYRPEDLRYTRSYRSVAGHKLVGLYVRPEQNRCDGPPLQEAFATRWFRLADDTVYVGQALELIDAGDYDADGRSELLFWHAAYNEDGYSLVFDGGRRSLHFWWNYH